MNIVRDILRRNINPLSSDSKLGDAVDQLLSANVSGLPVVDDHQQLVGFLSEFDCIPHLISGSYHCDSRLHVKDVMHESPLSVSPEDSIIDIAQKMSGNKPKVYPVIENGRLIGIVARQDILRALNQSLKSCVSYA
ncbi:CBS domain-containing protein [Endozoicomonas ascidiicola]|uniref:CBS domain-containing protein n=1 Tax=Endozoicomonas ascidiicola TaxID=1698521 RepID=UPI0008304BFA|nr:CBS domain-containing protein [Endozoicomonas ascidiicola]